MSDHRKATPKRAAGTSGVIPFPSGSQVGVSSPSVDPLPPAGHPARDRDPSLACRGWEAPAGVTVDNVVAHPPHYKADNGIEAIQVIKAWGLGYELGNAVKYILRHQAKGHPVQDLAKASWYLDYARGLDDLLVDPVGIPVPFKDIVKGFALSDNCEMALGCIEQIAKSDTLRETWFEGAIGWLREEQRLIQSLNDDIQGGA